MTQQRPERGRGLFLSRDSGGKHETTPRPYVAWAQREAKARGVSFNGTPDAIDEMIRTGSHASGDLFLDYGVSGNKLSRPGLNALINAIRQDHTVSHVFIPRPDRLARPDEAGDGLKLENTIRRLGVTLVYQDKVLAPQIPGVRQEQSEAVDRFSTFSRSGQDRQDLAQKMIWSKIELAENGHSIGGRPPYGFRRWLVDADRTPVRALRDGERVRLAGHHVDWLPVEHDHSEMKTIRRILEMLQSMPANQVAKMLTNEGIPTPDAGRMRTDRGHKHETRGIWHATTITNIAQNPILRGVMVAGRRSMGDELRFTPDGPRALGLGDFRDDWYTDDGKPKPKVIRNPPEALVKSPANFDPLFDPQELENLNKELDRRGGSQKGKARSRDPNKNPLGGRIFDLNCCWPMYRAPVGKSYDYRCAQYLQTHGQRCDHNRVNGPTSEQVVLGAIGQTLLHPERLAKLLERLRTLVTKRAGDNQAELALDRQRATVARLEKDLELAAENFLRLESEPQRQAGKRAMDKLEKNLQREQAALQTMSPPPATIDPDALVRDAVGLLRTLPSLAATTGDRSAVRRLIELVDARLYLGFEKRAQGKRMLNKVARGVLTFGAAKPPIEVYQGPTARNKLPSYSAEKTPAESQVADVCVDVSVGKDDSLRNANRGDRTAIELFVAGVGGWEAGLRREFADNKSKSKGQLPVSFPCKSRQGGHGCFR